MSMHQETWDQWFGADYGEETLKLPTVLPLITALPYRTTNPVAIDVGSNESSFMLQAELPNERHFRVASLDVGFSEISQGAEHLNLPVDINALIVGNNMADAAIIEGFLERCAAPDQPAQAELLLFSDILNYVDYQQTLTWFDQYLQPGGFMVIANQPGRGFYRYFHHKGVVSSEALTDYLCAKLKHTVLLQNFVPGDHYPQRGNDQEFMVLATQKPQS